jgi:hypothetical protein
VTAARDQALHNSVAADGVALLLQLQCSGTSEALEFVRCFNCLCLAVAVRDDHCLQSVSVRAAGPAASPAASPPSPQREQLANLQGSAVEAGQFVRANMNSRGDAYVSFCVLDLAAAPRGLALLAAATDKGQVIVFRTDTSRQYRTLYGHHCGEYARPCLAWDASARFLACTSDNDLAVHVLVRSDRRAAVADRRPRRDPARPARVPCATSSRAARTQRTRGTRTPSRPASIARSRSGPPARDSISLGRPPELTLT